MTAQSAAVYDQIAAQFERQTKKPIQRKKKNEEDLGKEDPEVTEHIKKLVNDMEDALLQDITSNKNKRPAFRRLQLLSRIENTIMKTAQWQEYFLLQDGAQRLADWLKPLPDETFPNKKIVLCIMGCIDRLPISEGELDGAERVSDIERTLEVYKNGYAGAGYNDCQTLAKSILNKWYRKRFNIQTTYDSEGRFDKGWRSLQMQLDRERQREVEADEDEEEEPARKR